MNKMLLLICFFIGSQKIVGQDLEGEWKGSFSNDKVNFIPGQEWEISFVFTRINDTTFQAFSKTISSHGKEKDSTICVLQGSFINSHTLLLKETRSITAYQGGTSSDCLQKMELFYRKRKKILSLQGSWETENNLCGYGRIVLTKSIIKK